MAFLLSFHTTATPLYLSTSKTPLLPLRSSLRLSAQSLSSPTTTSNRTSSSSSSLNNPKSTISSSSSSSTSSESLLCRNNVASSTAISCVHAGRASHWQKSEGEMKLKSTIFKGNEDHLSLSTGEVKMENESLLSFHALLLGVIPYLELTPEAHASVDARMNSLFEIGALFELGIQLTYLLILLALLGFGTFFVIRQVLIRRELDLSAKELQEQVRSGDATATEYFELGAVMLRRKFYPAAIKYLQQAVEKWDGDPQDLAQVYNALGVSYIREEKLEKGVQQLENAVKLQPGYVRAWNNLGDAYEKKKDLRNALKAFEEVLVFDPNNKVARPRRDALKERVQMFKGVPLKSEDK